jgi:opacity protein-like surface antigen
MNWPKDCACVSLTSSVGSEVVLTRSPCTVSTVLVAATVLAVEAAAQGRFVARGIVDANFATTDATALVGGGLGINMGPTVQLTVRAGREFGRAEPHNVPVPLLTLFPNASPEDLFVLVFIGDSVRVDRVLTGGVRVHLPVAQRWVRPFVDAEAGVTRVTVRYEPNPYGREGDTNRRMVLTVGGGLSIPLAHRIDVELGYHYGRLVRDSTNHHVNALTTGIAVGL